MVRIALVALPSLLAACSAVYDADDFRICETPEITAPPCAASVAVCINDRYADCTDGCGGDDGCVSECLADCFDANEDGMWNSAELECGRCVSFVGALDCFRDAGCAPEADAVYCCTQTLCDPTLGCTEGQCDAELAAFGSCAAGLAPGTCDNAHARCFPL